MPSTVIKRYRYDPARKELQISFQSGSVYTYRDVPGRVADELSQAFSKGQYFSSHIRSRFGFRKEHSRGRARKPADA